MRPVILIFTWLFAASGAFAQNAEETFDVVFLKNGKRHVGTIVIYEQGESLTLKEKSGERIVIPDEEISKIMQGISDDEYSEANSEMTKTAPIEARTAGLYNNTMLAFALGKGNGDAIALGAGLSTVLGFQLNDMFGIGVGIGLDNYARRGETVYPIFAEVRGFLPFKKKPSSYYLSFAGGYSLAFARESIGVREAEGGYMIHPSFGFRTPTRDGVDVNVDIGMKFQKAAFQHDLFNGDIRIRDLVFQRLTVRVGLTLWK